MRLDRSAGLALMIVALGAGWVPVRGADSDPTSSLQEKGLTKSGHIFVIEAEKPALVKIKEVRAAFASYATLADRQAVQEQVATQITRLEEHRVELQDNLNDMNQRINEQGNAQGNNQVQQGPGGGPQQKPFNPQMTARRDQLKNALSAVTQEQKSLKAQVPQAREKAALDEEAKKKGEGFKAALAALRPLVDEVNKKYAELAADESVKKALNELSKATKTSMKLGPSEAFLAGAKALDQAERRFLGKASTASASTSKKKSKPRR